jgi:hypothetical protein
MSTVTIGSRHSSGDVDPDDVYDQLVKKGGFHHAVQAVKETGKPLTSTRIVKSFVHSVNESGVLGEYGYDDDVSLDFDTASSVFHHAYHEKDGKWMLTR